MTALATVPVVIRPKLAKLIPLLGSSHDGEVVGAARAIGRTLQSAASDWHALAATVETVPVVRHGWHMPSPPPPFDPDAPPRWNDLCRSERGAWLDLLAKADWTTPWEQTLATNLRQQAWSQPHRLLTPRQKGILTSLIAKAMQRGERP